VAPRVLNESSAPRDRLARDSERPFAASAAHEHPAAFDLLTAPAVHYSTKWAVYLLSLKALVETGTGSPSPDDVAISDWH
jgi:hypothetical protein